MRFRLLLVMLALGVGAVLAQYKTVSIHDIQYVDSVGTKGWSPSTLTNDTVKVTGVIMIRPVISDTNRFPVMYYGTRWGTYIQDTSVAAVKEGWGGINVLQNDTTGDNQQTLFDIADTGSVVTITGVVTTYNETNELFLLLKPIQQVEYGKPLPKRPDPLVLTMSDLTSNKKVNKEYYKYSGTYVEFKDVIVSDVSSAGYFNINDDKGNQIEAYNQSRYYRTDNNKIPNYNYVPPVAGTHLSYIRGILTLYQDTYEILPIYPDDIV